MGKLHVEFLGTGTSQGVPLIACNCEVCLSMDSKDQRLRSSVWVQHPKASVVIDSGPDFRQQMLRSGVKNLDALLFTHAHKDHIAGTDDVRAFNYRQQKPMPIYADLRVQEALRREFFYAFEGTRYPGIPELNPIEIDDHPFELNGMPVVPLPVMHMNLPVKGFRIGPFAYITDANAIPLSTIDLLEDCEVLVLNALRHTAHPSHFTLEQALEQAHKIGAKHTYLTHISHQLGLHDAVEKRLPKGVFLAYDGLQLSFDIPD
ncbi:MAG: MBL fold metallo-hydrolase [Sphingomonadales bacterium]|nr:MBL fold metallo-hydrolase [Sphingomonadales bacterium]